MSRRLKVLLTWTLLLVTVGILMVYLVLSWSVQDPFRFTVERIVIGSTGQREIHMRVTNVSGWRARLRSSSICLTGTGGAFAIDTFGHDHRLLRAGESCIYELKSIWPPRVGASVDVFYYWTPRLPGWSHTTLKWMQQNIPKRVPASLIPGLPQKELQYLTLPELPEDGSMTGHVLPTPGAILYDATAPRPARAKEPAPATESPP